MPSSYATRTLVGTILRRSVATFEATPTSSFAVVLPRDTTQSQLLRTCGFRFHCCRGYRVVAPSTSAFEGRRRSPTSAGLTARRLLSGRSNGESEKQNGDGDGTKVEVTLDAKEGGQAQVDAVEIDLSIYTHGVKLKMPEMGEYDDENPGRVAKWYKRTGDIIRRKDTICDIELEAFTFGIDSDDEGITVMGEIHVPEGDPEPVKPGTPLCTILHPAEAKGDPEKED